MRLNPFVLALALALLAAAAPAQAQVIVNLAQARLEFTSTDHDAVVPPGVTGEGGALLVSYRAILLLSSADPVTGATTLFGTVVPKASATVISGTSPNQVFSLTFAQLGITTATFPTCAAVSPATCPAYSIILTATGPGGSTSRSTTSLSDSFSLASQVLPARPAPPSTVRVRVP
jgi:hypothetical protein